MKVRAVAHQNGIFTVGHQDHVGHALGWVEKSNPRQVAHDASIVGWWCKCEGVQYQTVPSNEGPTLLEYLWSLSCAMLCSD